jgi:Cd2+/Zn2+-exporting ATPase
MAFSLERLSTHPLARAITRHGKQQGIVPLEFDHFESITGQGLLAQRNGRACKLGKREWVTEGLVLSSVDFSAESDPGVSEIWIAEGDLLGRIRLRDDIRAQSRGVVDDLRAAGLRSIVLTGDHAKAAAHLQSELKLDDVRAGLKPEGKVEAIRKLSAEGQRVAMVGDGVNDAPSLAVAHVGVAMGARGSDAALEQADVVLMHDRLENFLAAFRLSVRARRVIRQNLVISLGTVAVLVTFALLGKIPLTLGVVGHEGSTVVVVMNSLRLLLGRRT